MSRRETETRPGGGFLVNFLKCLIDPSPEILRTLEFFPTEISPLSLATLSVQ